MMITILIRETNSSSNSYGGDIGVSGGGVGVGGVDGGGGGGGGAG